ncbi:MAG: cation:proton antiporter [Cytophagales bacterium]|nr:cation:proton antiporter [Cytophagales bacterium]
MRFVGLPPMLGFLVAGFVLNAFGLENTIVLERFGNLGILLLLFTIGLKLNIKSLFRKHVWQGGSGHMVIVVLIFSAILFILRYAGLNHFNELEGISIVVISFAMSFSSTVFAVKVLEEKGEMQSLIGKTAVSILIIQDILAVIYLTFSKGTFPSYYALLLLGFPLLRKPLLWLMNRTGHGEMMVLFGLTLALGGAELFNLVGIKPDLGALAAGLIVANTAKADEMSKTMLNFKEFFLVAFFLSIGLTGLPEFWMFGVALIFIILLPIKSLLYFWILTKFKLRARTSFWISLSLTNYSEFALIVGAVAVSTALISPEWLVIIVITVALSFLISAPLNAHLYFPIFEKYLSRFERKKRLADDRPIKIDGADILIFGMGEVGATTYDYMASKFGKHVIGLDADYNIVLNHKKERRNVIIGDATDSGFWENLVPGNVNLVVLSIKNHAANKNAVIRLKHSNYTGKIAAIAHYEDEITELKALGVDLVFSLYEEAGLGFAEHVCEVFGESEYPIKLDGAK